jgi:hypothetical protein
MSMSSTSDLVVRVLSKSERLPVELEHCLRLALDQKESFKGGLSSEAELDFPRDPTVAQLQTARQNLHYIGVFRKVQEKDGPGEALVYIDLKNDPGSFWVRIWEDLRRLPDEFDKDLIDRMTSFLQRSDLSVVVPE